MKQESRVILLHGRWPERINGKYIADIPLCNPNNAGNWMGWIKGRLEEKGYDVTCPIVSGAWKARYVEWKERLDALEINENTILVGLSAGGYALLRWLSERGKKVKKLVLIAPGSRRVLEEPNHEGLPFEDEFYSRDIQPSLRSQIKDGVVIFISNDSEPILESVELFKKILDAKVVKLEERGHFSFLIPQFPELLAELQK